MSRGIQGTYVIDWSQCEVDGMSGLTPKDLAKGARWLWRGKPVRLDGSQELLSLGQSQGSQDLQMRAARAVRKLLNTVVDVRDRRLAHGYAPADEPSVHLTDGKSSFFMHVIDYQMGILVMFEDDMPPPEKEVWVVSANKLSPQSSRKSAKASKGLIALTADCLVDTPVGKVFAGELQQGDLVTTLDHGPVPIVWCADRVISGARLHVMPQMRPVRIKAGAFGKDGPHRDMWVSAHQRILVRGSVAMDLYNTPEVLLAAKDLVNGRTVYLDSKIREVRYKALMFRHQDVMRANNMLVETFHPGRVDLETLGEEDRFRLFRALDALGDDAEEYEGNLRRRLSASEAALLKFATG